VTLNDAGGVGQKVWTFNTTGFTGLLSQYQGRDLSAGVTLQQVATTWTQATFGPYISSTTTTMNPGQTYAVSKVVNQTLDQFGNMTQMQVYDYSGALRRTYNNTYLATSAYTALLHSQPAAHVDRNGGRNDVQSRVEHLRLPLQRHYELRRDARVRFELHDLVPNAG